VKILISIYLLRSYYKGSAGDATRAPIQGPKWQGAAFDSCPKLKPKTPASISLLRPKNGLDKGVHFRPRRLRHMIRAVLECCAGIDVGKKIVVACILTGPADGEAREEARKYGTNTASLQRLRDWLSSRGCTHVVMKSTGAYWKPIFNGLEEIRRR
jgi:Transposase